MRPHNVRIMRRWYDNDMIQTRESFSPAAVSRTATHNLLAKHDPEHMVLLINGHRSIYVSWPADVFCEDCGSLCGKGYVGPAPRNHVFFPSQLHCLCENCARHAAGILPGELVGHRCIDQCTDKLHVEQISDEMAKSLIEGDPSSIPISLDLQSRGWKIADVTTTWSSHRVMSKQSLLWIESIRRFYVENNKSDTWII